MCWGCDRELPREAFHNDRGKKDGLQSKCKSCQYARYLERLAEDPVKVRAIASASQAKHRKRRMYGITNEIYDAMVAEREGRCDICQGVPPKLFVDHCHVGGHVRGLLCHGCNTGLGGFKDSPVAMQAAIRYLQRDDQFVSGAFV